MLRKLFYVIAAVLIVIWAVGFFVYALGALVHLVLIAAILLIAFKVSRTSRRVPKDRYDKTPRKF